MGKKTVKQEPLKPQPKPEEAEELDQDLDVPLEQEDDSFLDDDEDIPVEEESYLDNSRTSIASNEPEYKPNFSGYMNGVDWSAIDERKKKQRALNKR